MILLRVLFYGWVYVWRPYLLRLLGSCSSLTAGKEMLFQKVGQKKMNRRDHVWYKLEGRPGYKCCLCGARAVTPPGYPTPGDWMPQTFEALLPDERAMCPSPREAEK